MDIEQICEIILKNSSNPSNLQKVTEETLLQEIVADSLEPVEVRITLEEFYNVEIFDEEIDKISKVHELAKLVQTKMEGKTKNAGS